MSSTTLGKGDQCRASKQENSYSHFSFRFTSSKVPKFQELFTELHNFSDKCRFQLEKGKKGQKHYQGCFGWVKHKKRRTAVREYFKASFPELDFPKKDYLERSIIESGRASERYCMKEDTRVDGPWEWGLPKDHDSEIKLELQVVDLYRLDWQTEILELLKEKTDRKIHWYWEAEGGVGKSVFVKYLSFYHQVMKIGGRCHDIYFAAGKKDHYVIDIPRTVTTLSDAHYIAIEELKNGHIFSSKYESGEKLFAVPHVFIFANFEPDVWALAKLSRDRWVIRSLSISR